VNFYIKSKQSKTTAIYARLSYPRLWKYYPGITIQPGQWDGRKQRMKTNQENGVIINRILENLEQAALKIYYQAVARKKTLTKDEIKSELDQALGKTKAHGLLDFVRDFIRDQEGQKRYNTIKGYRVCFHRLQDFRPGVGLDDIDLNYFYDLVNHLREKGYKQNTIQTTIKNLKVFLSDACDRGLTQNRIHEHKKFGAAREEVDKIYLNESELEQLRDCEYSNPKLENARDLFLILAWTGLRISDLKQLTKKNIRDIQGQTCVTLKTTKTSNWITIPLHPVVLQVLDKYGYVIRMISGQKLNEYIKEAAKQAGLGNWSEITTHTGRRSMACNLLLAGFPETTIMNILGHKTYSAFKTYIGKLKAGDHVRIANSFWTQNQTHLRVA